VIRRATLGLGLFQVRERGYSGRLLRPTSLWVFEFRHVLNRSVARMHMSRKETDFDAFDRVMIEAHQRHPHPLDRRFDEIHRPGEIAKAE
jgi:hypothetical protein